MRALKIMVRPTSKRAGGRHIPAVCMFAGAGLAYIDGENRTEGIMSESRDEGLEERRKRLEAELAEHRIEARDEQARDAQSEQSRKGYAQAMKLSSEFISAIVVGAILGYLFDRFVGTAPWGMIVLLLLGFCAGVLNVLRSAGVVATPHPADRKMDEKSSDGDGGS